MANSIIAGNDFRLIIRAKKSTGAYLADMDLADVEDLRIYLTRAGRSKVLQSYTLDGEGHAVIYVSAGVVTNATYGIEMVGVYGGARLRAHNTSVFTISGHGGGNSGVLNDYYADIVFVINVAATDVYVQNAIEAHNEDEASHPHLLQLIENAGDVDDVQIDGESIVDENKIAKIDSSQFGKVDDVKVNGMSVVSNKEANITIPEKVSDLPNDADYATKQEAQQMVDDAKIDTVSVDYQEDGGAPDASASFEDGELAFSLKNMKMKFSDLTAADKAEIKGDKGDQGDSAVYDPSSPDAPDFVMANTTGQSTTKAMTQKAVTEALMNSPKSFVLNGLGGDNNSQITFRLKPGHMYEFALSKTTWSNSATVATIFSIGKYVGEEWSPLYTVTKGNAAQPKYLVTAEPDATGYTVAVRASVDEQIELTIRDINTIYSNVDTHFVGDSCTKTFKNSNGFRYYVRLDKEFQPPYILRLKGEMPDGIQWSMQGFATLANMQSISTNSVESTLYVDKATEHKFEGTPYCRVIFKSESGSLTSAQMATISKNIVLDVMSFGSGLNAVPIMDSDNNRIFPLTNSSSVYHDGNTLKTYLDTAVFYKEYPLDGMEKSSPIAARRRYTAKVPQIPFYASIEGSVPSGFICDLQTNYTLSDAQSPNVAEVQGSGWGGRSAYFDAGNAYYVTIGWKKQSNTGFTEEEIALLEASDVKLVVKNFSSGNDDDRTDIISLNDEKKTLTYLRNSKRPQYKGSSYSPTTTPCTLLHFSDIHADEPNMKRIVQFYNHYKAFIDDALCTGDIIQNLFGDSFAFWENAEAGSVLNCTGNHEYYNGESSAPYYKQITQKQVYDKFFAPYIEQWGVTQPVDAEENGLNYYYKDYATSKVRLIVLDNMRVDAAQLTWFEGVLADAITNGLHVVAAMHIGNPVGKIAYDNPFNSLRENHPSSLNGWIHEDSELLYNKVDDFIGNNGVFVGWLMGHIHSDAIGTPHDHPNQLEIHVATGSCGSAWDIIPKGDNCDRTPGSKSQDCFNIYSIDTYYKMIRIHRIGCDVDRDLRHIGNLCYDYENHRVIYVD